MKSDNKSVNPSSMKLNSDDTFTLHFGSKGALCDVPNRLDVCEGWNLLMRVNRAGSSVLKGSYRLPVAVPATSLNWPFVTEAGS